MSTIQTDRERLVTVLEEIAVLEARLSSVRSNYVSLAVFLKLEHEMDQAKVALSTAKSNTKTRQNLKTSYQKALNPPTPRFTPYTKEKIQELEASIEECDKIIATNQKTIQDAQIQIDDLNTRYPNFDVLIEQNSRELKEEGKTITQLVNAIAPLKAEAENLKYKLILTSSSQQ